MQLQTWVCSLWVKQRGYSVNSTKVKRVNLNLSVRRRPGTEWRFIVSIHDIEPSQGIVLVTLLFSYKTKGFACSSCVKGVLGINLEGVKRVLGSFHSILASTWYQSRVSRRDTIKRNKGNQVSKITYTPGKGKQKDQVLCHFFQFSRIQVRIQSYTSIIQSFFFNYSFVIN